MIDVTPSSAVATEAPTEASWRRGRAILGTIGFVLAVGYTWTAFQLPFGTEQQPGAAIFPVVVGIAFALVSVGTVIEAFVLKSEVKTLVLPTGADARRLIVVMGAFVGYVVLLPFLGHLIASMVFGVVSVRMLSTRSWLYSAIAGCLIGAAIYFVFVVLLGVRMPGILGG
jgi:putative tricarboxylic transport membrane protein